MSKIRRVDFYADEWLAGTRRLDALETGIYITACALIYSNDGPVAIGDLREAARCHGHAFNRAYKRLIELGKLTENDGQISNKRCINELQNARIRIEKAQQNGGKGGRPRNKNKDMPKPGGFREEKLTINHQPPTTNLEGSVGSNEPTAAEAAPPPVVAVPPPLIVVAGTAHKPPPDPKRETYTLGRAILGKSAGGMITKLLDMHDGDCAATLYTLRQAQAAAFPREYLGRILSGEERAPVDWNNHPVYRGML
ncbi:MAG TPA: DUF1376 domain-containing protein [Bryobacteraceae bacterium]|nr:DUF1376 domain-containing protein [Bryobacteraceae bacterium]